MNKTNDVQKVREREREGEQGEEAELKAEMGQYVFLLHFHLGKASLRSLFPEHGGVYVCACMCVCVRTRVCAHVQRLKCEVVRMHTHVHAYMGACP